MPITLTDEQAAALRAHHQNLERKAAVADRATKIWNDPKTSDRAKALWKEAFPEDAIGDYDLKTEVFGRLDRERKEREDADKAAREKAADDRAKAQRADVQKSYGFTDDAMKRLEDLMIERNIGDYEAAATYFASKEPKPVEETGGAHFWNHDRQDTFKEIAKDPEGWGFGEIQKAVVADARARGIR